MGVGVAAVPVIVKAVLACHKRGCEERWESQPFPISYHRQEETRARPAIEAGWRVFVGARSQHAYCPNHGPSSDMEIVFDVDHLPLDEWGRP